MTTIIQKWGNGQGIKIPKMILESVNWTENEEIIITVEDEKLVIQKAENKKRKNIKELFKDYKGDYKSIEIDWRDLEGEEIW